MTWKIREKNQYFLKDACLCPLKLVEHATGKERRKVGGSKFPYYTSTWLCLCLSQKQGLLTLLKRAEKKNDYLVSHLWPKTWWQSSYGCTCMDNTFNKKAGRHKKEDNNCVGDKSS